MPKLNKVRAVTEEESKRIRQLARSRTEGAALVGRAQIILMSHEGKRAPQIAEELRILRICGRTVRRWIERFNAEGIEGLLERRKSGRQPTYTQEQRGEVVAASLTDPQSLGLPFGCWTLDRLEAYLNEEKGISIKRSRIAELLQAEGLRWRTQERWFTERAELDPAFVEKRGPSSVSTHKERHSLSKA